MIEVPDEVRRRLVVRFGDDVLPWVDALPARVAGLVARFGTPPDGPVLAGNSAVVVPTETSVLKLHPDPAIAADEATALAHWAPADRVVDLLDAEITADDGALLLARVEPGTALPPGTSATDPAVLPALRRLWETEGTPPGLGAAVDRMRFGLGLVRRRADDDRVRAALPDEVLDRGEARALDLAARPGGRQGLCHGDLHGANLLAGPEGAVVIDPRPCVGDRTGDLVDLVLADPWRLEATIEHLARELDGLDPALLLAWCTALAPANAVAALRADPGSPRTAALVHLATSSGRPGPPPQP